MRGSGEGNVTVKRILVVEDDALTRKFFAAAIRDRFPDAEILETNNVATARTKVDANPALVITDILLGDGSGTDVLEAVRSSMNPRTWVLAVTGLSGADIDELRARGFDDVLTKPVNLADLRAILARVFAL